MIARPTLEFQRCSVGRHTARDVWTPREDRHAFYNKMYMWRGGSNVPSRPRRSLSDRISIGSSLAFPGAYVYMPSVSGCAFALSCHVIDRGNGYEDPKPFVVVVCRVITAGRIHLFVGSQRAKGGVMVTTTLGYIYSGSTTISKASLDTCD